MIREMIRSWRTPASKAARKLGYLYESIAMQERFRRRKESWRGHIEKCHQVTLREIRAAGVDGQLAILGSGPLNEVPLEELLPMFRKIHLVDIVHPLEVRSKWERNPKIELHELDLTGVAERMLNYKTGPLPDPSPPVLPAADFILSANCLSQLPHKPAERAKNLKSGNDIEKFCEKISAAHIEQIKKLKVPHLIIADFQTDILDENEKLAERSQPFFDFDRLRLVEKWSWSISPKGEFYRKKSVLMTVGAFTVS